MKRFGVLLIIIGIIWGLVAFNMDTTVQTESMSIGGMYIPSRSVNNLGKMDERRNHLIAAGLALLIGVILLSSNQSKQKEESTTPNCGERKCPFCAELVKREAVVCKHCQRDLPPEPEAPPAPPVALQPGYSPCPKCNATVNDESVKCWSCDTRIRAI
jgi:hypothetical protein